MRRNLVLVTTTAVHLLPCAIVVFLCGVHLSPQTIDCSRPGLREFSPEEQFSQNVWSVHCRHSTSANVTSDNAVHVLTCISAVTKLRTGLRQALPHLRHAYALMSPCLLSSHAMPTKRQTGPRVGATAELDYPGQWSERRAEALRPPDAAV